uniref:Uncharacterized protein n=1 Tax=Sinocyclocheilus rhinocerous TaxID=307959 RepID=A0A673JGB7_9TELE
MEQRAQALLHDQASQLQQLGLSMELHTGEELEKDRTLAQAVQSLSDAKLELRRKDQSLRSLGKQLSQSQQENKQLQHDIASAENALTTVEMNKESLMNHVILSRRASSRNDFTLQLSRLSLIPSDLQRIVGNPETEACQVQTLTNHILQLSMQSAYCADVDACFILSCMPIHTSLLSLHARYAC